MRVATVADGDRSVEVRVERLRWHRGGVRLEARHIPGGADSVTIVPESSDGPITTERIVVAIETARRLGGPRARIVTPALTAEESEAFRGAGFQVASRLHLLVCDLATVDVAPEHRRSRTIRRGVSADVPAALAVDRRAFDEPWVLDRAGFTGARRATPTSRFRVAIHDGRVAGYAITGRSGRRGYLQRLAVEPAHQGRGLGAALVLDGIAWCRRRGVRRIVVNTQVGNVRALRLYRTHGFRDAALGLSIMALPDGDSVDAPGPSPFPG